MKDYIFSNDFSRNLDAMIYTAEMKPALLPTATAGGSQRLSDHYILSGKGIYKQTDMSIICPKETLF